MQTERLENVFTDLVVSLAEIKEHLIVNHDDDDVLITRYVLAALAFAENRCERTFRLRRLKTSGACWPPDGVLLRFGPVRQVESVEYVDTDGATQILSTETWRVSPENGGTRLTFDTSPPWPKYGRPDAVSVTYLAGYGVLPDTTQNAIGFPYTLPIVLGYSKQSQQVDVKNRLPDNVKHAVYMLVGHWYENRETVVVGTANSALAIAVEDLLNQERVFGV